MLNLLELIDPQSWDTDRVVAWVTGQAHAGKKPAAECQRGSADAMSHVMVQAQAIIDFDRGKVSARTSRQSNLSPVTFQSAPSNPQERQLNIQK
jgi:hypothetical protein